VRLRPYFLMMSTAFPAFLHRSSLVVDSTPPQTQTHSIPFRLCTHLSHTYIQHPHHFSSFSSTSTPINRALPSSRRPCPLRRRLRPRLPNQIKTFLDANPSEVSRLLSTRPENADFTTMWKAAFDGNGESSHCRSSLRGAWLAPSLRGFCCAND
jgi:hypothetical protein